jgi:hypothetical protein
VIPPGQYTFPFQFLLNNDLPGSFRQEGINDGLNYLA